MRSFSIKNIVTASALGLLVVLGSGQLADAQNRDWRQQRAIEEQQRQQAAEQEREREEQERMNNGRGWQNGRNIQNGTDPATYDNNRRYRVSRNGRNYNTDGRGAELLRQAVNQGYQQGYAAGRADRSNRRRSSYSNQGMYRSGNYGYDNHVDRSQYRYYFQQASSVGIRTAITAATSTALSTAETLRS